MSTRYRRLYERIASELRLTARDAFECRAPGRPPLRLTCASREPGAAGAASGASAPVDGLTRFIYAAYYLEDPLELARLAAGEPDHVPLWGRENAAFVARLREANRGTVCPEAGWRVVRQEPDGIVVQKDGVQLLAQPAELRASGGLHPGSAVTVLFPSDRPYLSPGFFTTVADAGAPTGRAGAVVRIYLNVTPVGAPRLISLVTGALCAAGVPYVLKVLNDPRRFTRPDAAVLYLDGQDFPAVREALARHAEALLGLLGARTPAFAKPLAPGVAVAEEPTGPGAGMRSFGQHRSALVARGLATAFNRQGGEAGARLAGILEELTGAGLDADRPYLNPGSADAYEPLVAALAGCA